MNRGIIYIRSHIKLVSSVENRGNVGNTEERFLMGYLMSADANLHDGAAEFLQQERDSMFSKLVASFKAVVEPSF